MRNTIVNAIFDRMARDKSLFLLTADMGINLFERFAETYPDRFLNVGICEQNLMSVAAGLANGGYRPITYAFSIFSSIRCMEQVRDDIALHKYPVIIFGLTTGYDHSQFGPTHQEVDDWGMLRTIPKIEIYCPSSIEYATALAEDVLSRRVCCYLRVPKGDFRNPPSREHIVHLPGNENETLLASYGSPVQACLKAQEINRRLGVLVFNRLRPVNDKEIASTLSGYRRIIVVEDHFAETGLYATLCQILATKRISIEVETRAPLDYYFDSGASPEHFWKKFGADATQLASA